MSELVSEMLSLEEVCRFFGGGTRPLDKSTIYRWVRNGRLAKPILMGEGSVSRTSRWRRTDCQKTLDAIIAEQRPSKSEEA
jgi:predicted DNA-binding transcriptional regulator AlpA